VTDWLQSVLPAAQSQLTQQSRAQLTADSRRISAGDVFLAYPGDAGDGRQYIAQAIEAGARAVLYDACGGFEWNVQCDVPHLAIAELRQAAGLIAHAWYEQPDQGMFAVAVTGTNGKTSCTQWLGQALSRNGLPTTVIGTLGVGLFQNGQVNHFEETGYTTPDAVQLQRHLATQKQLGACAYAIEASSIGLHQGRMNGLHVDVAVFTNLTRDHLDYHGSMEAYEAAKARLFEWPDIKHAVINLDDPISPRLLAQVRARKPDVTIFAYTIGEAVEIEGVAVLRASEMRNSPLGTIFQMTSPMGIAQVRSHLIGRFNISNLLAIAGVLFARGLDLQEVVILLEALTPVPGRMQQLGGIDAPLAVIDYAHTPDALEKTLHALRQVAHERHGALWCVFGCGGDRDPGKRPQMALAALHADHQIITSDNPRSEDPAAIIAQITASLSTADTVKFNVIEDRASAILFAIKHAGKQDVVLIAGKGHEGYQEIKGRRLAFVDAEHAALALATRATRNGGH
jgi:UDP-N-acetylmuramoyl-L-alanyl-D-glutamate--2,6-diaminopimelate ligase